MKRRKWLFIAIGAVLAIVALPFIGLMAAQVVWDWGRPDEVAVEREIRAGLAVGSPRTDVEAYLTKHSYPFTYDPASNSMDVPLGPLKGSGFPCGYYMQFRLHFTAQERLRLIETSRWSICL